jgi:CheY-like chemotaxis protein
MMPEWKECDPVPALVFDDEPFISLAIEEMLRGSVVSTVAAFGTRGAMLELAERERPDPGRSPHF